MLLSWAAVAQDTAPAQDPVMSPGQYLATAGNCISCHTREGGDPFAGGVAFVTDFGRIYSTNITPDATNGIGGWTEEQFVRAMREGIAADGTHLYPAFPYTDFALVTDADLKAIWAYLKTVKPSSQQPPANEMGFPFNQRSLMSIWNTLFFNGAPFKPTEGQSAAWNRGAYLVEGLGHCGACHTPRNFLGAEDDSRALSGGTYLDKVKGGAYRPWSAVNLTSADDGLKTWSADDLMSYMKTGHSIRAGTYGPMNEVIENSLRHLTDDDLTAIATYIKALPPIQRSPQLSLSAADLREGDTQYTIHCGTCHLPTGLGSTPGSELGPPLVGSAVVQAEDPASLINVILHGGEVPQPPPPKGWTTMKAFGNILDDEQAAAIATYVRASWGNRGGKVTAAEVARQR
jgi:mono/diheme cytochrome c family protein